MKNSKSGGKNTVFFGKKFEDKTDIQNTLLEEGYNKKEIFSNNKNKYNYYLIKNFNDKTIVFLLHNGLKLYMKYKYNIDIFRYPDEAYIIEYRNGAKIIKILEKKAQNIDGSVETKLWSGPSLKREYEILMGDKFKVFYSLCLNDFLMKKIISREKKYEILNIILEESDIKIFFGDEENYMKNIINWITD